MSPCDRVFLFMCVFNSPLLVCRHWDTHTLTSSGMHVLVPTEERDRVMGSFLRGSRMGRRKLRRREKEEERLGRGRGRRRRKKREEEEKIGGGLFHPVSKV